MIDLTGKIEILPIARSFARCAQGLRVLVLQGASGSIEPFQIEGAYAHGATNLLALAFKLLSRLVLQY